MTHGNRVRAGYSLVEVLVVVAILALLLGLTLAAIQKARMGANRTESFNNIRQLLLATHHYAAAHDGALPEVAMPVKPDGHTTVFNLLLPYLDDGAIWQNVRRDMRNYRVHVYLNPADPSLVDLDRAADTASYGANAQVFHSKPRLAASFPDGLSTTIGFAERYSECGTVASFGDGPPVRTRTIYYLSDVVMPAQHRATVADGLYGDVYPYRLQNPPNTTTASLKGQTFQAAPTVDDCYPSVAQSPFPTGLQVGMMDGSTRTLSPSIAVRTYWPLFTPNGGEVIGDF
jgi:prepilin-type N-terminal cleavage/methylation domain-containing protein